MNAPSAFLALRIVDGNDFDPMLLEPLRCSFTAIDGKEDFAWLDSQAIDDHRIVGVMDIYIADFQILQEIQKPVRKANHADEG